MSPEYTVTARRWSGGWELHIKDEGVTQVRSLEEAVLQVRDYLETVHQRDFAAAAIVIGVED